VHSEQLTLQDPDGAQALVAGLRGLIPDGASVGTTVSEIVAAVHAGGDAAVLDCTRRFDTGGADPLPLRVPDRVLDRALQELDLRLRAGLERAVAQVGEVAAAGLMEDRVVDFGSHQVTTREVPVQRAAIYVPGGRAPYPSTVVMGVVTARAAGVSEVVVCSPPRGEEEIDPVILATCRLAGTSEVYRMGGAQSIAALAYGTESVRPVDVIVGPGQLWVQEAKRQVAGAGLVGIDGFAGPSDLLVIADGDSALEPIALDLLAQAEHGTGTLVLGASTDPALLVALAARIEPEADTGAVCRLVLLPDDQAGVALAQAFAPEHLELIGPHAEALAPQITRAGCMFIGLGSATAFGDYIAGSNHVLPTEGAARFASGLSAISFRRRFSVVSVGDGTAMARAAAPIARAEGYELHARSMEARIRENEGR
jgi:histidinol dehydrogenase